MLNKHISIHEEVKRVISNLHLRGYDTAVVAGGYLRDLYFGIPFSDIDVFIHDKHENMDEDDIINLFELKDVLDENGDIVERLGDSDPNGSCFGRHNHLISVFNIWKNQLPFQAVLLNKPPQEYINNYFDTGINMCFYDGKRIRYTPEFMHDVDNKIITVRGIQEPYELHKCVTLHVPRLLKKFPKFDVRIDIDSIMGFKQVF